MTVPTPEKKPPRKVGARHSGNTTRDRIIARSIFLFNRMGMRNVAIDRIAMDLMISPGNLTYHFPRKQELINATLEVMKQRLRTALERPTAVRAPQDGADYLLRLYGTLWDFRFFFNALTHVLTDPHMRREYTEIHSWAMESMDTILSDLCELGHFLLPVKPNSFRMLSENMWDLWLSWLRRQQVRSPLAATPNNAGLYDCALHNWSLCQPWMRENFARDLLVIFQEKLLPNTSIIEGVARRKPAK